MWVPGIPPARPAGAAARRPGATLLSATGSRWRGCAAHPVASGIDLAVRAGAALAITGPNGAGKSTLGLTLAGLLPPASGRVSAAARSPAGVPADPIRWASRQLLTRIGTVFQEPEHQLLAKTVREELEVGPRALGLRRRETAARVDELLERLRLAPLAGANPYTLSGGEKRRLTVAAALATAPRVLVLDEPTFGQDARTWAELVALLAGLRDDGSAIVAITHDLDVVEALHARALRASECGRVTLLDAHARTGRIVAGQSRRQARRGALIAHPARAHARLGLGGGRPGAGAACCCRSPASAGASSGRALDRLGRSRR